MDSGCSFLFLVSASTGDEGCELGPQQLLHDHGLRLACPRLVLPPHLVRALSGNHPRSIPPIPQNLRKYLKPSRVSVCYGWCLNKGLPPSHPATVSSPWQYDTVACMPCLLLSEGTHHPMLHFRSTLDKHAERFGSKRQREQRDAGTAAGEGTETRAGTHSASIEIIP